jgi:dihydrofolate reductase
LQLITALPKLVFSKTINKSEWTNATVVNGDIVDEVNRLKGQKGKDLLVYAGHGFVSSLVDHYLIDEFHFLLNPTAYGDGLSIFSGLQDSLRLKLARSKEFSCGTVLLHYEISRH